MIQVPEITYQQERELFPFLGLRRERDKIELFQGLIMKTQMCLLLLLLSLPTLIYGQAKVDDSIDATFSNPTNLSDKQMDDAKNFTHQGIRERAMKEGCKKIDDCKDDEGFPLEMLIGKAYAMIGMMSGGGAFSLKGKITQADKDAADITNATNKKAAMDANQDPSKVKEVKPEGEKKIDYCAMVAMANETLGGMIQSSMQKQADNSATAPGDAQIQALISLKQTHETRKKTASFQAGVYTGVTTCYAAMALAGAEMSDPGFIAKSAGAAALMVLYWKKAIKHKKAVKAVEAVMASMENTGKNCNPWTKSACFCSEATSKTLYPMEYEDVCVLNKGNFETPKIALGCGAVVGGKINYDKECKCKQTNTCMKSGLKAYNPKFGLGNNLMSEANKTFDMLGSGEFDQGQLDEARLNASVMISKIKLRPGSNFPRPNLTDEQKKVADALKPFMPEAAANLAAAANSPYRGGIYDSAATTASVSKLPASIREKLAHSINVGYKQGDGFNAIEEEPSFEMPIMPGQAQESAGGTEIVSFAEAAVSKADVSNTPETPIFDIISNRYRRSGWQKLDRFEK